MIRLGLAGGDSTLFVLGITDMNVDRMTRGFPILMDLEPLGGQGSVVVVHGSKHEDLRRELAKVVPADELAKLTSTLDQLGAMERDVAARGGADA